MQDIFGVWATCGVSCTCISKEAFTPFSGEESFPPSGNAKIQKLIAKHVFECFEKKKRGRRQKVNTLELN